MKPRHPIAQTHPDPGPEQPGRPSPAQPEFDPVYRPDETGTQREGDSHDREAGDLPPVPRPERGH